MTSAQTRSGSRAGRPRATDERPSPCLGPLLPQGQRAHQRAEKAKAVARSRVHHHPRGRAGREQRPSRLPSRPQGIDGLNPADWTPRELRHSFVSLLSDAGRSDLAPGRPRRHERYRVGLPPPDPPPGPGGGRGHGQPLCSEQAERRCTVGCTPGRGRRRGADANRRHRRRPRDQKVSLTSRNAPAGWAGAWWSRLSESNRRPNHYEASALQLKTTQRQTATVHGRPGNTVHRSTRVGTDVGTRRSATGRPTHIAGGETRIEQMFV